VQSLACNKKDEVPKDTSDDDGNNMLVADTDCGSAVLCMSQTVMDVNKMRTGTKFDCAADNVAVEEEGCKIKDGIKTCYCKTANCNKYKKADFYNPIKCNVKDEVPKDTSDVDGNALLVATDCDEGIKMCMNMTVMDADKKITGTKFDCAGADQTTAECKTADGIQTCSCEGAECNKYTQAYFYSSAVTISTPALLISALIVSGFASTS
jgi:hypothetical protein